MPEVAGLAGFLDEHLRGAVVSSVQIVSFAVLKTADPPYTALEGRTVDGVRRFGKFVSIDAGGLSLVFHLARAGWVRFTDSPAAGRLKQGKGYIAARLAFEGPDGPHGFDLTEAGTRKSLAVYVVRDPQEVPGIASLGPDPSVQGSTPARSRRSCGQVRSRSRGSFEARALLPGSVTPTATRSCTPRAFHRSRSPSPWLPTRWLPCSLPSTPSSVRRWPRPGASRRRTSRTSKEATCGSMPGPGCPARYAGTPSARSPSRTLPCSTAPRARPRAGSWQTAGRRSS